MSNILKKTKQKNPRTRRKSHHHHTSLHPHLTLNCLSTAGRYHCTGCHNCTVQIVTRWCANSIIWLIMYLEWKFPQLPVAAGSPSRGWNVAVYVFNTNQPSLPTPFLSFLVSVSVFMALSTVFHSINSPDNSSLSHSGLPVLCQSNWSFQLYISL